MTKLQGQRSSAEFSMRLIDGDSHGARSKLATDYSLNIAVAFDVDCGGRLVEDEDLGPAQEGSLCTRGQLVTELREKG